MLAALTLSRLAFAQRASHLGASRLVRGGDGFFADPFGLCRLVRISLRDAFLACTYQRP